MNKLERSGPSMEVLVSWENAMKLLMTHTQCGRVHIPTADVLQGCRRVKIFAKYNKIYF